MNALSLLFLVLGGIADMTTQPPPPPPPPAPVCVVAPSNNKNAPVCPAREILR